MRDKKRGKKDLIPFFLLKKKIRFSFVLENVKRRWNQMCLQQRRKKLLRSFLFKRETQRIKPFQIPLENMMKFVSYASKIL